MPTREEVLRRHVHPIYRNAHIPNPNTAPVYQCFAQRRHGGTCLRGATQMIDGYAFCTQHAKMVRADLEKHGV